MSEKMDVQGNHGDYFIRKQHRTDKYQQMIEGRAIHRQAKACILTDLARRVADALPSGSFYMKGGFFLGVLTKRPRYTEDLDMSLIDMTYYELLRDVLTDYGEELKSAGKIDRYVVKDRVEERMSGGAVFYAGQSVYVSIDVSQAKAFLSTAVIEVTGVGSVRVNTVEQVLCDKISVLFSRSRFRRIKDLYDIYTILDSCSVDVGLVKSLLVDREVFPFNFAEYPFTEERLKGILHAYETFVIGDADGITELDKPALRDVVEVVSAFLGKLEVLE